MENNTNNNSTIITQTIQNNQKVSTFYQINTDKIPKFYSNELNHCRTAKTFWFVIWCITTCIVLGFSIFAFVTCGPVGGYCLIALLIPFVIVSALTYSKSKHYKWWLKESKIIDFSKEKVVSINIQKTYKRLRVSSININWTCFSIYIFLLAAYFILLLLSVVLGIRFGGAGFDWKNADNWWKNLINGVNWKNGFRRIWTPSADEAGNVYFVCSISFIICFCFTIIYHPYALVSTSNRIEAIDEFYGFPIVSDEIIEKARKKAFWRGFILFAIMSIFLFFIVFGIYKNYKTASLNKNNITSPTIPTSVI